MVRGSEECLQNTAKKFLGKVSRKCGATKGTTSCTIERAYDATTEIKIMTMTLQTQTSILPCFACRQRKQARRPQLEWGDADTYILYMFTVGRTRLRA